MVTISEVAQLAGVSVTTVSRVINDYPHVSKAKKDKVFWAMDKLGYVPMQAARQMRGSGSQTIGVVVPAIINPFFSYLINAIERTVDKLHYKTLIIQTFGRKQNELTALDYLKRHQVDGIILCALENDWDIIKGYQKYGQIAVCNEYVDEDTIPMVIGDQFNGLRQGTEYLISKGKTKIAYCTGRDSLILQQRGKNFDSDRYLGFTTALQAHDLSFNPAWLFTNAHSIEDGQAILKQLSQMTQKPDAIITGSDEVATGIVSLAKSLNIKIPQDLSVLGVDDQPLAKFLSHPLTTIRQPITQMGQQVAEVLIDNIKGTAEPAQKIKLDLQIVPRESA
ncbi:MAG: LacI family DNA-binding transcriptional regulator [Lactobacillus sp.]|nr:LacI family DNA-binding transcriptional regulator [Lactobacillus sp.]